MSIELTSEQREMLRAIATRPGRSARDVRFAATILGADMGLRQLWMQSRIPSAAEYLRQAAEFGVDELGYAPGRKCPHKTFASVWDLEILAEFDAAAAMQSSRPAKKARRLRPKRDYIARRPSGAGVQTAGMRVDLDVYEQLTAHCKELRISRLALASDILGPVADNLPALQAAAEQDGTTVAVLLAAALDSELGREDARRNGEVSGSERVGEAVRRCA